MLPPPKPAPVHSRTARTTTVGDARTTAAPGRRPLLDATTNVAAPPRRGRRRRMPETRRTHSRLPLPRRERSSRLGFPRNRSRRRFPTRPPSRCLPLRCSRWRPRNRRCHRWQWRRSPSVRRRAPGSSPPRRRPCDRCTPTGARWGRTSTSGASRSLLKQCPCPALLTQNRQLSRGTCVSRCAGQRSRMRFGRPATRALVRRQTPAVRQLRRDRRNARKRRFATECSRGRSRRSRWCSLVAPATRSSFFKCRSCTCRESGWLRGAGPRPSCSGWSSSPC